MYTTAADLPSWAPHRRPRPRYPPYRSPPSPQALSRARALLRRLARSPPSCACPPAATTRGHPATTSSPPSHARSPSDGDELATLLRALALRSSETLGDLGSGNGEQKREGEEHHRRRVYSKMPPPSDTCDAGPGAALSGSGAALSDARPSRAWNLYPWTSIVRFQNGGSLCPNSLRALFSIWDLRMQFWRPSSYATDI
jgi:hypothetical protein